MQETILIVYLVVAIALVGIILLQQGKGAEMGASFGAGGANTVFGAGGSGNALTKTTTVLAILFFAIALGISYLNSTPVVVVDEIYGDAPVTEKKSLESELPQADEAAKSGLEAELPPAEKIEEVGAAAAEATDKLEAESIEKTEQAETKQEDDKN
ncbi:MAG: preprotein translocase subunit SecG [Kangiellaceae bacterium]|nr:preprotein translocase subunit SecG [Kangiellaceae bacterium]